MSGGRRDVCVALVQSLRLFLSGFDHLKGGGDMLVSVNAPPLRPTHKHTNSPSPAIRGPMGTGSAASCGLSSQGGGQHRYLPANGVAMQEGCSGGGITCVTIAEAMVTKSPLFPFSTGSKS